jgi:hypothetical protein
MINKLNIRRMKSVLIIVVLMTFINNKVDSKTCQSGDCVNGYGIQVNPNGQSYIGEFKEGKRSGHGVFYTSTNTKYVGDWKYDRRHGFGQVFLHDNPIVSGIWKDNLLGESTKISEGCVTGNCDNGFGSYIYADGRRIYGRFSNNTVNDYVICYYPDGQKYIGEWENNKRNGFGTSFKLGVITQGFWNNAVYEGSRENQEFGCIAGNCDEGLGIYIYSNLTRYEGKFKDGKTNGYGICYFPDGEIYAGNWKNHAFDGVGIHYSHDGGVIDGYWKNGVLQKNNPQEGKSLDYTEKEEKPNIYAVIVGVSRYTAIISLKYSDDDAYLMHSFFRSPKGGALRDDNLTILIDEMATLEKIKSNLRKVSEQATSNDIILFYFSGHGINGAFLPSDYDGNTQVLKHKEVLEIMENSLAKSKIVIADACYTGSFSTKGGEQDYNLDVLYDAFENTKGGTLLLLSSKEQEASIESKVLHQGVFSYYLIKGLNGGANRNSDEIITVEELFEYVYVNVVSSTHSKQNPIIRGNYDKNMPLGLSRN